MADRASTRSWWLQAGVRKIAGWAAWTTAIATTAVASAGCSAAAQPPTAYVTTTVQDPDTVAGVCNFSNATTVYSLVGASANPLTTGLPNTGVANGSIPPGLSVAASVKCSVVQTASGFNVSAEIQTGIGGTFDLTGASPWSGDAGPTGATDGVNISFGANDNSYGGTNCSVTYETFTPGPIEPGRVWGTFNCPDMMEAGGSSGQPYVCMGTGTFQLTNCTQ
jgi:hypothetical protein